MAGRPSCALGFVGEATVAPATSKLHREWVSSQQHCKIPAAAAGLRQGRMTRSSTRPTTEVCDRRQAPVGEAFFVAASEPSKVKTPLRREDVEVEHPGPRRARTSHQRVVLVGVQCDQEGADGEEQGARPPPPRSPGPGAAERRPVVVTALRSATCLFLSEVPRPLEGSHSNGPPNLRPRHGRRRSDHGGAPGAHLPWNCALPGPFSTKDRMPVVRSSVANRAANCWRSISSRSRVDLDAAVDALLWRPGRRTTRPRRTAGPRRRPRRTPGRPAPPGRRARSRAPRRPSRTGR